MNGPGSTAADVVALVPEIVLLLGAVVGLLVGLWTPQRRQARVAALAVLACLTSAGAAVADLGEPDRAVFDGTWVIDTTTGVVRIVVALSVAVVIVLFSSAFAGHPRETEGYVLMLLGAVGAVALGASSDLLMLMAAYLLASVPLYALVGFTKDARGVEATLKYYLVGALAGVLMLIGIAALTLAGGRTGYAAMAADLPGASTSLVAVGVLGVVAGVAFKAGAVPVHFWVPDVTAGTQSAMAAYITTVPKIGAVAAAFRLVEGPFAELTVDVPLLMGIIAAASMTLGNLAAFAQTELLRLLAYSTVSQVGYLFMVVAVASRTDLAVPALTIYLAGYAVTNLGAFAAVAASPAATIGEWAETAREHRWLVLSLVVCLLGLVGTPPTAVFVGKLAVFAASADGEMVWLVVLAAVNTVASLFYYLRWAAPALEAVNASISRVGTDASSLETGAEPGRTIVAPVAAATLHGAAAASVLLGIGAGAWLALVG